MLSLLFFTSHLFFLVLIFYLVITFFTGAPFVPSHPKSAHVMVKLAHLKPGITIYDLGSGDGRILLLAAEAGVKAVGFEINPILVLWTKLRALFSPYGKNITVRWMNFWKADLSAPNVVFVYLLPHNMNTLQKLLKNNLKKGSLVVSNSFIFPDWKIVNTDTKNHIYVFKI